jgi:hypothetical protein
MIRIAFLYCKILVYKGLDSYLLVQERFCGLLLITFGHKPPVASSLSNPAQRLAGSNYCCIFYNTKRQLRYFGFFMQAFAQVKQSIGGTCGGKAAQNSAF